MNSFPREVCFPERKLCLTEREFYDEVNKYNKLKNIYYSLYSCDENRNFGNCVIDKVAFDFDASNPESILGEVTKFCEYLHNNDLKHLVVFSGKKGFHVYIFCKNGDSLVFKKDALRHAHEYFTKLLDLHPDKSLFGDIKRILRVPNTFHATGNRYCIPLTIRDLKEGMKFILEKACKQFFKYELGGNQLFDLKQFDYESVNSSVEMPVFNNDLVVSDDAIKNFLPCVQCWLLNASTPLLKESGTWEARYQFAIYCREIGVNKKECNRLAKKYFGRVVNRGSLGGRGTNYDHFVKVRALEFAYGKNDFFWNCDTLYGKGLCPGKCTKFKELGSPLYKNPIRE
jgi:hypothetical protein